MFINCNAQRKPVKKINHRKKYKMEIPNITKDNLEIPKLSDLVNQENKKVLEKTNDSSKLISESTKKLQFNKNGFDYFYENGKLVGMGKAIGTIPPPQIKSREELFEQRLNTDISFYSNEKIRMIRQFSYTPQGYFPIGNWYAYDEAGNLLQHIDHEKHFKMSYYEVAQIADTYDYPSITIFRGVYLPYNFSYWIVDFKGFPEEQPQRREWLIINDKTGKIIYNLDETGRQYYGTHEFDKLEKYKVDLDNETLKVLKSIDYEKSNEYVENMYRPFNIK
ncbi:hypothetical protein ACM39_03595 [Chryseobacterium sp. FH2]|nr:hypothetical protein ACM39_03595 [Chryseobacterium sp. FH2]